MREYDPVLDWCPSNTLVQLPSCSSFMLQYAPVPPVIQPSSNSSLMNVCILEVSWGQTINLSVCL